MSRKLFGTDGIRGLAGVYPLDSTGATQIGKAIGKLFAKSGDSILIGMDPRESSQSLVDSVTSGLTSIGVNVISVGVLPTPGLAFLTKNEEVVAGVMITASHNAYTDNGIKVFTANGNKLSDETEAKLNELIDSTISTQTAGTVMKDDNLIAKYEEFLVQTAGSSRLTGIHIAVDTANGATCGIAKRVFERLGATVEPMFDTPNGTNINDKCGATDTKELEQAVISQKLDAGIAFDGDGDRVMIIDQNGRLLNGDHILYILAVAGQYNGVVATIMSNMGLDSTLSEHGISIKRTKVGDRYVLEGLEQTGYQLGGEQSGHIILPNLNPTGDGILAAVQVLKVIQATEKSLSQWFDELKLLPQVLVNIQVADKSVIDNPEIQEFISASMKELGDKGRINIRPSGTEPKIRLMVESTDAEERSARLARELTILLEQQG